MYTVYALTDGLCEDIAETESLDDAYAFYEAAIGRELILRDTLDAYAETTVHLFDAHESAMAPIAEHCVTTAL